MNPSDKQQLRRTAVDWVLKQQLGNLGPEQQQQLEQWLRRDPAHADALAEAERAWAISAELSDVVQQPIPHPRQRWRPLLDWLAGMRPVPLGAALLVLCALLVVWQPARLHISADHYTSRGEIREVQLEDGSRVMLSGRSAIAVEYDQQQRYVRLLRGEAVFSPAPQNEREPRPFMVETAGGSNRALGTVFLLKREDADQGRLSVLEHSVQISLQQPADQPARMVVHAGQSARYRRTGEIDLLPLAPGSAASWTQGLLSYDGLPLGSVIDDLNNHGQQRIVLLDRRAAEQPITAAFHLDSLDKALQLLSEQHQLRIAQLPGVTLVY